jgi:hypothetical protein
LALYKVIRDYLSAMARMNSRYPYKSSDFVIYELSEDKLNVKISQKQHKIFVCNTDFVLLICPGNCRTISKSKAKLFHYTRRRPLGWTEVYLLFILDLSTRWGRVVSVTPRARFSLGEKDPRYPLYRRLNGPQNQAGHRG